MTKPDRDIAREALAQAATAIALAQRLLEPPALWNGQISRLEIAHVRAAVRTALLTSPTDPGLRELEDQIVCAESGYLSVHGGPALARLRVIAEGLAARHGSCRNLAARLAVST